MKSVLKTMKLKIGDKVSVIADKKTRVGEVIFETDYFYTVKFPNYNECFLKKDIENGTVETEIVN